MASEITGNIYAAFAKAGVSANFPSLALTTTVAATQAENGSQIIGFAADEVLSIGDVTSPAGTIIVYNTDATNYVELSTGTGGAFAAGRFAKIRPGRCMLWEPAVAGAIYIQANTAACTIQKFIIDA